MITTNAIRNTWSRFGAGRSEVWLCPRGDRVELRIVIVDPWVQDAMLVGVYTGEALLADFMADVREAEKEFLGGIRRAA